MCWIFGYVGKNTKISAESIIIAGLSRLEYRGYDSAGIAVATENGQVDVFKSIGNVAKLQELITGSKSPRKNYISGIGHTRWATHGHVNLENTHPHSDQKKWVFVVHNGIIENYRELKLRVLDQKFTGETDTEVVAKLIAESPLSSLFERVIAVMWDLQGAYALVVSSPEDPSELIGVKYGSPLVLARGKSGAFYLASDTNAVSEHVSSVVYLEDGDVVHIQSGVHTITQNGVKIDRPFSHIEKAGNTLLKGKFEHYMLKEIYEAPNVLEDVFRGRINFTDGTIAADAFRDIRDIPFTRIEFIACGTSYHAGLLGSYWVEELSDVDTGVTLASEFFSRTPRVRKDTLFVFISQSWETADSIEPLKWLKAQWAHTFGVVNVVGSTIARLADGGLFTRAGVEIGVASTKAYIGQIGALLIMSLFLSIQCGAEYTVYRKILSEIENLPQLAGDILDLSGSIKKVSVDLSRFAHLFFLGRGPSYAMALEAALKFKEITYIHAHAVPIWELKHGSLALIDANCPSVVFIPDDIHRQHNLSAIAEIQARGGKVCAISQTPIAEANWNIILPSCPPIFFGFLAATAGQLLAYHAAKELGREIDRPRNLAKSVTVR
jgi:glutamine---fructose-6-phosphate transaminase (isomerizing)